MYKIIKKRRWYKSAFFGFCFNLSEKSQQNFIAMPAPLAMLLFFTLESICGILNTVLVVTNHPWLFIFKLITIKYNLKIQFLRHTKHVKCTWPVVTGYRVQLHRHFHHHSFTGPWLPSSPIASSTLSPDVHLSFCPPPTRYQIICATLFCSPPPKVIAPPVSKSLEVPLCSRSDSISQ